MNRLTWLGHAGFLVESKGMLLAIDPWRKGPTWPNRDLAGLDLLALTHGHFDHAESAPDILRETGATAVAQFEVALWLRSRGVAPERVVDVNKGGTWRKEGWSLTMVDAVHSSGCPGPDDAHPVPGGEAAGWIVHTPDDEVLYHAGDTTAFGDMALIRKLYKPKVAMLPIGGHYTMGPLEAAEAVRMLGVKHVVPMHYGTFPLLAGSPAELQERVGKTVRVHTLRPGETMDLAALVAPRAARVSVKLTRKAARRAPKRRARDE